MGSRLLRRRPQQPALHWPRRRSTRLPLTVLDRADAWSLVLHQLQLTGSLTEGTWRIIQCIRRPLSSRTSQSASRIREAHSEAARTLHRILPQLSPPGLHDLSACRVAAEGDYGNQGRQPPDFYGERFLWSPRRLPSGRERLVLQRAGSEHDSLRA